MVKQLAPPEVVAYVLLDLALIVLAARVLGACFERLRQPRIVGEMIAGILLGPTVLGGELDMAADPSSGRAAVAGSGLVAAIFPLQAFSFLNAFGQVALILYMFLVGLELDTRLLRGRGVQVVAVAVAATLVPVGLGYACGAVLDGEPWKPGSVSGATFSLFLGAGLSVTAFPVMARILQERNMMATKMGAIGIGSAAVVTVLMFLVIAAASASANRAGVLETVSLRFLLLGGLLALLLGARPLIARVLRWRSEEDRPSGDAIALMLIGALVCGLATDRILGAGLVGGFLFGLAIPASEKLSKSVVARLSDAVVLLFLPVFLAVSGLRTNLRLFTPELVGGLLLFLALMIVGKWATGYLAGRAVGLDGRDANAIGVLLNCRGLLILVVGLIGLQFGVITPETQLVFVIGAIVTTLMTGPLMNRITADRATTPPPPEARRTAADPAVSGTGAIAG